MKNSATLPGGNANPSVPTRRIVRTHILGTGGYEGEKGAPGAPSWPISMAYRRALVEIRIGGQRRHGNGMFLQLLQYDGHRTLELRVMSGGDIFRQLLDHDIWSNDVPFDFPLTVEAINGRARRRD